VSVVEPGAVRTAIWDKGRALADQLEEELPEEATTRYRRWIDLIRRGIDASDRGGVEPEVVARAVEHALFSARPKARYPVGTDSKAGALASRLLPDPVRDRVVRRMAEQL
jgi:NAD(P)-dependent dehydrogenase (short-subunit alcohol dehydrogenase family)